MKFIPKAVSSFVVVAFTVTALSVATSPHGAKAANSPVISALPAISKFAFGIANAPGNVNQMKINGSPFTYRYQYLAGGVNTGGGWYTWNPNGEFASLYMQESAANDLIPVFTYYQLLQSRPSTGSGEDERDFSNLNNVETMRAYYVEFTALLDRARAFGKPVIVHVEPDLAGYMQQRVVATTNSAASITAAVANTGIAELAGVSNTYQGFNQALLRLRDRHAPNVALATHASAWSTKIDVSISTDRNVDVSQVARTTAQFLRTAGLARSEGNQSTYDVVFVDASDRDAGFYKVVNNDGGVHWWDETNVKLPNFANFHRYLQSLTIAAETKAFVWQVPIGNTVMRSLNNTWNHFQDNRVQYWLGGYPADGHLASLAQSGVIGIMWGRGADGGTSADDTANDGITNPPAINGNDRVSTVADDDGGYLKQRMLAYQAAPLALAGSVAPVNPTVESTVAATSVVAPTSTVAATSTASTTATPSTGANATTSSTTAPIGPTATTQSTGVVLVKPSTSLATATTSSATGSTGPTTSTATTKPTVVTATSQIPGSPLNISGGTTTFTISVAKTGKHKITFETSATDANGVLRVFVNNTPVSQRLKVPKSSAKSPRRKWTTKSVFLRSGAHIVTFSVEAGSIRIFNAKIR
jgi:hypothetical protein